MNKTPKFIICLFFLFISFTIYANSLNGDFILDDQASLIDNIYVKDISFIPKLFTISAYHFQSGNTLIPQGFYRPFQSVSYALEYFFWQLNPFGYHLVNVLMHSLNSFLLFLLIYFIFKDSILALLSAVLFCVHPMQACLVSFVSARGHLLMEMFSFLSLLAFIRFIRIHNRGFLILSLLSFVCALLSWEGAIMLIFLIMICMLFLRVNKKDMIIYSLPYFLISIVYFLLHNHYMPCDKLLLADFSLLKALSIFSYYIYSYINQLIFPYGMRLILFGRNVFLGYFLFVLSLIVLGYFIIRAVLLKDKITGFAFLFYCAGLLLVVSLHDTMVYFGIILSEHYVCISIIGFCLLLAYFFISLKPCFKKPAAISFILLINFYSSLTIINNINYTNERRLYEHVISVNKDNTFVRVNLGNIYLADGDYVKAKQQADFVLALEPYAWDGYLLLGNIYNEKGDFKKAEELYEKSAVLNPGASEPLINLGLIYYEQGQKDNAIEIFEKAIKLNPESIITLQYMADLLREKKMYNQSFGFAKRMLELSPRDINAFIRAGIALAELGRIKDAEAMFKEAVRLYPDSIDAINNLASLYGNTGNFDRALLLWNKALEINPKNEQIKQNIKRVKMLKGY